MHKSVARLVMVKTAQLGSVKEKPAIVKQVDSGSGMRAVDGDVSAGRS